MRDNLIFDAWTPMSFKRALSGRKQPGIRYDEPTWVGHHSRRLAAYKILQAYVDNAAREFLAIEDPEARDSHREYGDASLIRDTILAALLGDDQEIVVPDAADYDPNETDAEGDHALEQAAWDLQDWLRKLWDTERGALKLMEVERDAVGLGDGVYSVGWSPEKGRPRLRVWDPGFYFPVLDDGNDDDYPERVHIAWETEADDAPGKVRIRRLTWQLGPIQPAVAAEPGLIGRVLGAPTEDVLHPGDVRNSLGRIQRQYAWDDAPSGVTCYYTDATWELDTTATRRVDELDPEEAMYGFDEQGEIRDRDLFIDFLPVVHVPNTVAVKNHFGRSALSTILQILDDLSNSDTDAQAASATSARPILTLEGGTLGRRAPSFQPGEVWELGEGKLNTIDTSKSLDAILQYIEFLLARLSVNGRTPESLLGRVKPSEVPSGVALAMSFGPLSTLVGEMRLSRNEKYPLLLKFLWRTALAGQAQDVPAQWFESRVEFGSYLPQDRMAAVDIVTKLRQTSPPSISLETAAAILVAAGLPIEDATEEVARIEAKDFEGADALKTATGSQSLTLDYLQMEDPGDVQARPAPPEVILGDPNTDPNAGPPVPPGQPGQ